LRGRHNRCPVLRFEVDGANAERNFLLERGISEGHIATVWNAIALHTTPGIPEFIRPEIALVQVGQEWTWPAAATICPEAQRHAVIAAPPREAGFEDGNSDAFYQGMKHRPDIAFGTFNDDILAFNDPYFKEWTCAV
jgi:hypothetical protein